MIKQMIKQRIKQLLWGKSMCLHECRQKMTQKYSLRWEKKKKAILNTAGTVMESLQGSLIGAKA